MIDPDVKILTSVMGIVGAIFVGWFGMRKYTKQDTQSTNRTEAVDINKLLERSDQQMDKFQKRIDCLDKKVRELQAENLKINKKLAVFEKENAALKQENAELRKE